MATSTKAKTNRKPTTTARAKQVTTTARAKQVRSKAVVSPAVFEQVVAQAEKVVDAAPHTPELPRAAPSSKGQGIGALVKDLLAQGLTNDEVLAKVKEQFPSASTNKACVSWYRSAMKKAAK